MSNTTIRDYVEDIDAMGMRAAFGYAADIRRAVWDWPEADREAGLLLAKYAELRGEMLDMRRRRERNGAVWLIGQMAQVYLEIPAEFRW